MPTTKKKRTRTKADPRRPCAVHVGANCTASEKAMWERIARSQDLTLSQLIRRAMRREVEEWEARSA